MEKERLVIKWLTRDKEAIAAIRQRFSIPNYTTVNGFSPVELADEDREVFEECQRRGFFTIFHQKWCKNGEAFSF